MTQIGADEMDQREVATRLAWWNGPGRAPGAGFARLLGDPSLPRAAIALAGEMLELSANDRALDMIFKDAGRYVVAMWALHLDEEAGGLTLGRLQALCAQSGLLSRGRARALLQVLEHIGFVERPATSSGDYRITASFRTAWTAQVRAALRCGALLEPGLARLLEAPDPAVLASFQRLHAQGLLDAVADSPEMPPLMRVFMHPHAGNQVVWALLVGGSGEAFPKRAGPISISALSRRFGVSRIHIKRIFETAEREGLAHLERDGMVDFEETARAQMAFMYSGQFAAIISAGAAAAAAHGLLQSADLAAA